MSLQERHRREREARAKAILAAAARVFARHGLDGATIEMVAREAEVAVGTIYLYFSSRDDLYLNLMAQRAEHLRDRYLEIQSRKLEPLAELRAISAAYLDYLRDGRELFLTQQSVGHTRLRNRLRRPCEIRHFNRVMEMSHQIWSRWEAAIRRCFEAGVIANKIGPVKTAAVIWASLNGAFMLMGDDNFFAELTGLDPEHFVEEALESHLVGSQSSPAGRLNASSGETRRSVNAARTIRIKNREKRAQEVGAPAPA